MRVLPVVAGHMVQALHYLLVVHFDGQLAPAVKAPRGEIDGTDDRALAVSQQHLGVELEVFERVDLNADVVENTNTTHTLDQLFLLKRVGCPGHHVDLYPTPYRTHQALDDDRVLVALVLNEQRVLCPIYKLSDTVTTIVVAPDETRLVSHIKFFSVPVGLETVDDFLHLVVMCGDDSIIACLRQVLGFPVERFHERGLVVHHHRLLVCDHERRIAVDHCDTHLLEFPARRFVLWLAATPGRIEHNPDFDPTLVCSDHGGEQRRVGE